MNELYLRIPTREEMVFKKIMKEDKDTMDYNAGYNVSYSGYDYATGTIQTDIEELKNQWYNKWIDNWPERYYAYITLKESDKFIGEIYALYQREIDAYEIGIVIKGEYRGKGYATPSIKLLIEELKKSGAKKLIHEIPSCRFSAIQSDLSNGFRITGENYFGIYKKFGQPEKMTRLELKL